MNVKKTLSTIVLAAALSLGGCRGDPTPEKANYLDYNLSTVSNSTLTGKIVKVQPSSVSFIGELRGNGYWGAYGSENHEFEYVVMKDKNNHTHTLIYPRSHAILEENAIINYIPIAGEIISSDDFIKRYIKGDYTTDDNVPICAEGIITRDGIKYK